MNNPLRWIDPSGLTDVTVDTINLSYATQYWLAYMNQAFSTNVNTGFNAIYAITGQDGTTTTVTGYSGGGLPIAVYNAANEMRQAEGDNDLNIFWDYENLSLLDHYTYNPGEESPRTNGKYVFYSESDYANSVTYQMYDSSSGPEPESRAFGYFLGVIIRSSPYISLVLPFLGTPRLITFIFGGSNIIAGEFDKGALSVGKNLMVENSKVWDPDNPNYLTFPK
jgi:hypothetical protein